MFDVVDHDVWDIQDLTDTSGSDSNVGNLPTALDDGRAGEEYDGWVYVAEANDHKLWRSRTPETTSSYTLLGTLPSDADDTHSLFVHDDSLWGMTGDSIYRIPDPTNPSAALDNIQSLPATATVARGAVTMGGDTLYLWAHGGYKFWVIPDVLNAGTGTAHSLSGAPSGFDVRAMTDFNGRLIIHEEGDEDLYEVLDFDSDSPSTVKLGDYDSSAGFINALAAWSGNAAAIVSSVASTEVTNSGATITLISTSAEADGPTFYVRYRVTGTTTWSQSAVTSTSALVTVTLSGLTNNAAYEYQGSLDDNFPSDARAAGTFTTLESAVPGDISGLSIGTRTSTSVVVDWDDDSDADAYLIQWDDDGSTNWPNESTPTDSTHTITALDPYATYDIRVKGTSTGGDDGEWAYTEATTLLSTPASVTLSPTSTTIVVDWADVSGATGYTVRHQESGDATTETTVTTTASEYTITSLFRQHGVQRGSPG